MQARNNIYLVYTKFNVPSFGSGNAFFGGTLSFYMVWATLSTWLDSPYHTIVSQSHPTYGIFKNDRDDHVEEENPSQHPEAHFVRAGAIEMHMNHFAWLFRRKIAYAYSRANVSYEPAQVEMHMDISQESFAWSLVLPPKGVQRRKKMH